MILTEWKQDIYTENGKVRLAKQGVFGTRIKKAIITYPDGGFDEYEVGEFHPQMGTVQHIDVDDDELTIKFDTWKPYLVELTVFRGFPYQLIYTYVEADK